MTTKDKKIDDVEEELAIEDEFMKALKDGIDEEELKKRIYRSQVFEFGKECEAEHNRIERLYKLRHRFEATVEEIELCMNENFEDEVTRREAKRELDKIERGVERAVLLDLDPETEKPRFTNQSMRDNERHRRLQGHEEFQELHARVDTMSDRISSRKDRLEVLRYEFRSLEAQLSIEGILSGGRP